MDQNQLNAFLGQKPRPTVDSMHSSLPLLSVPQAAPLSRGQPPAEYTDTPAPVLSPYSDHGHATVQLNNDVREDNTAPSGFLPSPYSDHGHATVQLNNDIRGDDTAPSGFLPSPYSQHGHGDDDQDEPVPKPQPRILTASPRPESQFYAPIAVQPADVSIRALEEAVAGSRPTTPGSLSMMTHGTARISLAAPDETGH